MMNKYDCDRKMQMTLRRNFDIRAKDFSRIINEYWLERSNDIWTLWQSLDTAESENKLNAFYELCVCFQALKRQNIEPALMVDLFERFQQVIEKSIDFYFTDLCTFFCAETWIDELNLICEKLEVLEKTSLNEEKISKYQGKINEFWQEWEDASLMHALLLKEEKHKQKTQSEVEELEDLSFEIKQVNQWILLNPMVFSRIGLHISAKAWAMKADESQWEESMKGMIIVYEKVLDSCDQE
jgi:hypothetical protein